MCYSRNARKLLVAQVEIYDSPHLVISIVYIIEEGEYPSSLCTCVTTLYGGHDFCNDIHRLEASVVA